MNESLVLHWIDGGSAHIVQTDGHFATLQSTRQAAVETPLVARVRLESAERIRFKVKDCRREPNGFLLVGRWVDLSKTTREELLAITAA